MAPMCPGTLLNSIFPACVSDRSLGSPLGGDLRSEGSTQAHLTGPNRSALLLTAPPALAQSYTLFNCQSADAKMDLTAA